MFKKGITLSKNKNDIFRNNYQIIIQKLSNNQISDK